MGRRRDQAGFPWGPHSDRRRPAAAGVATESALPASGSGLAARREVVRMQAWSWILTISSATPDLDELPDERIGQHP
jgi:hypothetical protein